MEILEKIGDTIFQVGKDVTQKAKDVSGIAKLRMDIRAKEEFIKEQYLEIGEACYKRHKGEDLEEQAKFDRIDEAFDAIAKMEHQILELKGARKCPDCGAMASDTAEYCSVCGAKLVVVVDEEQGEEAKDVEEPAQADANEEVSDS